MRTALHARPLSDFVAIFVDVCEVVLRNGAYGVVEGAHDACRQQACRHELGARPQAPGHGRSRPAARRARRSAARSLILSHVRWHVALPSCRIRAGSTAAHFAFYADHSLVADLCAKMRITLLFSD